MLSSDETKAGGRPNQRKGKPAQAGKKGERNRKAAAPPETKPDRAEDAIEEIGASASPTEQFEAPTTVAETIAAAPADAETMPVDYRTLAEAYGDYSRTSLDQARSFFEQLAGVRSFDRALELQTAFARQAYENFATQSQRIRELHQQMARQRWQRLEGLMTGKTGRSSVPRG
jgi:hypothetical protein